MEDVVLKVITNDGDIATCEACIDGEVVDTVKFEREEDTVEQFRQAFPIGLERTSQRLLTDAKGFEEQRELAAQSRVSKDKRRKCGGKK